MQNIINKRWYSPTGCGIGNFLLIPSMPAIIIEANPKYGFAHTSNIFISKLVTTPFEAPGGQQALTGNSLLSYPSK